MIVFKTLTIIASPGGFASAGRSSLEHIVQVGLRQGRGVTLHFIIVAFGQPG